MLIFMSIVANLNAFYLQMAYKSVPVSGRIFYDTSTRATITNVVSGPQFEQNRNANNYAENYGCSW